jgi:hypothetical protein
VDVKRAFIVVGTCYTIASITNVARTRERADSIGALG